MTPVRQSKVPGAKYMGRFKRDGAAWLDPVTGERANLPGGSASFGCYAVPGGLYDVWLEFRPRPAASPNLN